MALPRFRRMRQQLESPMVDSMRQAKCVSNHPWSTAGAKRSASQITHASQHAPSQVRQPTSSAPTPPALRTTFSPSSSGHLLYVLWLTGVSNPDCPAETQPNTHPPDQRFRPLPNITNGQGDMNVTTQHNAVSACSTPAARNTFPVSKSPG